MMKHVFSELNQQSETSVLLKARLGTYKAFLYKLLKEN